MSRRDWLHHAPIRGCLIVLLLCGYATGSNAQDDNPPQSASTEANQQQGQPTGEPARRDKVPDAPSYSPNCERPKDHDDADYCQQIRMADAAQQSLVWAKIHAGLGLLTVVGLLATIIYGARNAKGAIVAAEAAERSARVAEASARHVERPYVLIGEISFGIINPNLPLLSLTGGGGITVDYIIYNRGRMPAVIFEIGYCLDFVKFGETGIAVYKPPVVPNYQKANVGTVMIVIGAGGESPKRPSLLRSDEIYGPGPHHPVPIIFGYIKYRDAAGRRYQAGFGFSWIGSQMDTKFGVTPVGQIITPYGGEEYNYDRELTDES